MNNKVLNIIQGNIACITCCCRFIQIYSLRILSRKILKRMKMFNEMHAVLSE